MHLDADLRIIHEPVRLRILGLLYRQNDLGFAAIRDALGLTPGNLASHGARLREAGLVTERDALTRAGFEKRYQVTPRGLELFERYLAGLESFLAASRNVPAARAYSQPEPAHPAPAAKFARTLRRTSLGLVGIGGLFVAGEAAQLYVQGASGSSYLGVAVAGALVTALAPLQRMAQRFLL